MPKKSVTSTNLKRGYESKMTEDCFLISVDRPTFLSFQKGDLIVLDQNNDQLLVHSSWCYGECIRTGLFGDFPAECVYVLPTITKPPPEILVCRFIVAVHESLFEAQNCLVVT